MTMALVAGSLACVLAMVDCADDAITSSREDRLIAAVWYWVAMCGWFVVAVSLIWHAVVD